MSSKRRRDAPADALELTGGLLISVGGTPGYRLTMTSSRVVIAPRSRLVSALCPTFAFPWQAVREVSGDTDDLGLHMQLSFALKEPPDVRGGMLPHLWRRFVRRPGFILSERSSFERRWEPFRPTSLIGPRD
jgi:hypothetical protein